MNRTNVHAEGYAGKGSGRTGFLWRWQGRAWLVHVGIGVLAICIGGYYYALGAPPEPETYATITGESWDATVESRPGMAAYVAIIARSQAQFMIGFGFLVAALSGFPFRRFERWAWFAMWIFPATQAVLAVRVALAGSDVGWIIIVVLLAVSVAGLLLPAPRFFPRRPQAAFTTA